MSVTETTMQAVLMRWAMGTLNHIYVVQNSTVIFPWESDLISVTKAFFAHEYEIKISISDYRKDRKKIYKHYRLNGGPGYKQRPNYFWYATFDFDIEPPDHAGWLKVTWDEKKTNHRIEIKKPAPRLCDHKLTEQQHIQVAKLLSWRMANFYTRYLNEDLRAELERENQ